MVTRKFSCGAPFARVPRPDAHETPTAAHISFDRHGAGAVREREHTSEENGERIPVPVCMCYSPQVQVLLVRASLKVERVLIFVHRSTCRPPTAPVCLTLWRHPCDKRTRRGLILSGLGLSRSKGKDICWKDDSSFSNGSPFHVQISITNAIFAEMRTHLGSIFDSVDVILLSTSSIKTPST